MHRPFSVSKSSFSLAASVSVFNGTSKSQEAAAPVGWKQRSLQVKKHSLFCAKNRDNNSWHVCTERAVNQRHQIRPNLGSNFFLTYDVSCSITVKISYVSNKNIIWYCHIQKCPPSPQLCSLVKKESGKYKKLNTWTISLFIMKITFPRKKEKKNQHLQVGVLCCVTMFSLLLSSSYYYWIYRCWLRLTFCWI